MLVPGITWGYVMCMCSYPGTHDWQGESTLCSNQTEPAVEQVKHNSTMLHDKFLKLHHNIAYCTIMLQAAPHLQRPVTNCNTMLRITPQCYKLKHICILHLKLQHAFKHHHAVIDSPTALLCNPLQEL